MTKNIGKTVLVLVLVKSTILLGWYLYNKYNKEVTDFNNKLKKDLKDVNTTFNNATLQAKKDVVKVSSSVVAKAEDVLESMKKDMTNLKQDKVGELVKPVEKATKSVIKKIATKKVPAKKVVATKPSVKKISK